MIAVVTDKITAIVIDTILKIFLPALGCPGVYGMMSESGCIA